MCLLRFCRFSFSVSAYPGQHGAEFKLIKYCFDLRKIRSGILQIFFIELNRSFRIDGCQFFRQNCLFCIFLYKLLLSAFQFRASGNNLFNTSEFLQQRSSCFRTEAGNARNVIGGVALKTKHIHHLRHIFNIPFLTYFFLSQNIHTVSHERRFIQPDILTDNLSEIFIGSHHINLESFFGRLDSQRTYQVVGFKAIYFENRNIETF